MTTGFKINRKVLAEMAELAVRTKLDTSSLTYTEVQQVITLDSLIELLASFNIDAGFELAIEGIRQDVANDDDTRA